MFFWPASNLINDDLAENLIELFSVKWAGTLREFQQHQQKATVTTKLDLLKQLHYISKKIYSPL